MRQGNGAAPIYRGRAVPAILSMSCPDLIRASIKGTF